MQKTSPGQSVAPGAKVSKDRETSTVSLGRGPAVISLGRTMLLRFGWTALLTPVITPGRMIGVLFLIWLDGDSGHLKRSWFKTAKALYFG